MTESMTNSEGAIEFGPQHLEPIPYGAINTLQQVRTQYDESAIEELALAIESGEHGVVVDSSRFELQNPLLNGRHTLKSARRYIDEHGDFWGIASRDRIDPQDLTPLEDDTAVILIAGHRRRRAIGYLLEKNGISPQRASVVSDVRDNIEFGHAVSLQLRENRYERPLPQEEARAIEFAYRYAGRTNGQLPTINSLAQQFGFSETKIRDALAFSSLPRSIQEYTTSKLLSYTTVCQLKPLYEAFLGARPEDPQRAELLLLEFCNTTLARQLAGKSEQTITQVIINRTQELRSLAEYQQGDLFVFDQFVQRRARDAGVALGKTALAVMRHRLRVGGVSDDELDEIAELLRQRQEEREREAAFIQEDLLEGPQVS